MNSPVYDPKNVQRSLDRAVRESTASAVSGANETYFTAYALLLKAGAQQIGFLSAVPTLIGALMQLLAAAVGHAGVRRKPVIVGGIVLQALMWLPIVWLPYLFPAHGVTLFLVAVTVYYAGANLASPAWMSLLGDLVPDGERGRYFGGRSRLSTLANFLALTGSGLALQFFKQYDAARLGFGVVFTVAMFARLYSGLQVVHMIDPAHGRPAPMPTFRHLLHGLRGSNFLRFSLFMAVMNFSAAIAGPFFAVYMLRDLHFSYLQFTASTASVVAVQFFTLSMWGRLGDVFGNRVILAVTGFITPVLPVLWLISGSFVWVLMIQLLGGLTWSGFNLSAGNFVYDNVPSYKRATYGAFHSVLGAVATFLGAALGGFLGARLPAHAVAGGLHLTFTSSLGWVFLLSTVARFATAASFIPRLREVRPVRAISPVALAGRVLGVGALSNVWSQLLGRR